MKNKRWKRANALKAGLVLMLAVFLIQTKPVSAAPAIPAQSKEFYANDFAGIMSQEVKSYIIDHSNALQKETKAQVVVAAVDSLEGDAVENYANRMFRQYEIGDKEKNNGILILIAVEDREVRIEVGYGLEGAINDAKAGRIIRQIGTPYLSDENWDAGIKAMYAAVMKEVYAEYNLKEPKDVQQMERVSDSENTIDPFTVIIALIVIVFVISNFRNGGGRGGRGRRYYGGYGGYGRGFGGGFGGFGGSGGGFGGGSFGGGGSSGGGGASGKF